MSAPSMRKHIIIAVAFLCAATQLAGCASDKARATALHNDGATYVMQHQPRMGLIFLNLAIGTRRALYRSDPEGYAYSLANTLGYLAKAHQELGEKDQALNEVNEAIDILTPRVEQNPELHAPVLQTLNDLKQQLAAQ